MTSRDDADETTPGDGVRIETDRARGGSSFGVWKILVGSLLLAVVGYVLVSVFFIGDTMNGG